MCVKKSWILVADLEKLVVKHIDTQKKMALLSKNMKLFNLKLLK